MSNTPEVTLAPIDEELLKVIQLLGPCQRRALLDRRAAELWRELKSQLAGRSALSQRRLCARVVESGALPSALPVLDSQSKRLRKRELGKRQVASRLHS